MCVCVRGW